MTPLRKSCGVRLIASTKIRLNEAPPRCRARACGLALITLRAKGETRVKLCHVAAVLSLVTLALSGCAQQQPSAFETALPKLRDQCVAGDNQACEKIAEGACLNGTPETCRADCWPMIVERACASFRPEDMGRALPGPGLGPRNF